MTKHLFLLLILNLIFIFHSTSQSNLPCESTKNHLSQKGIAQSIEFISVTKHEVNIGSIAKTISPTINKLKIQATEAVKQIAVFAKKPKSRNFLDTLSDIQPSV